MRTRLEDYFSHSFFQSQMSDVSERTLPPLFY
jgi:hypothetical protein